MNDRRDTIASLIEAIIPCDAQEMAHIDFVKKWIASGAPLWRLEKPDIPNIHFVAYFLPFDYETKQFLLVDHKLAGLWLPPGGHVEPGEHPNETVIREAKEELFIDAQLLVESPLFVTVTQTVATAQSHTDVSLWYVLTCQASAHLRYDESEFHQVRWFAREEIPYERTDPHLRRFIKKMEAYVDSATTLI